MRWRPMSDPWGVLSSDPDEAVDVRDKSPSVSGRVNGGEIRGWACGAPALFSRSAPLLVDGGLCSASRTGTLPDVPVGMDAVVGAWGRGCDGVAEVPPALSSSSSASLERLPRAALNL